MSPVLVFQHITLLLHFLFLCVSVRECQVIHNILHYLFMCKPDQWYPLYQFKQSFIIIVLFNFSSRFFRDARYWIFCRYADILQLIWPIIGIYTNIYVYIFFPHLIAEINKFPLQQNLHTVLLCILLPCWPPGKCRHINTLNTKLKSM